MSKTKIKVGFAGTPKIAFDIFNEILLSDEISTEFVLTQPDKLSGRGLTASKSLFTNSAKLPVLQPDDLNSKDLVDIYGYEMPTFNAIDRGEIPKVPEFKGKNLKIMDNKISEIFT